MKSFFSLIIILALYSCNKSESVWNDLTQAERDYLTQQEQQKCVSDSQSHFDSFTENSDRNFFGSDAFKRGTTWSYTFKKSTATDPSDFSKFTIWKVTTSAVYLLNVVGDDERYQFIKITKAENDTMISALQTALCNKTVKIDKGSSTGTIRYDRKTTGTSPKKFSYTFTYSTSLLAFFTNFKEARTEQPLDDDGNASGTASKYTGTLSNAAKPTSTSLAHDTYGEYTATGTPIDVCVLASTTVSTSDHIPYDLSCSPTAFDTTEL